MINKKLFEKKIYNSGLLKNEIAKKCRISQSTLYLIMQGRVIPSVEIAIKLSEVLNFDIKEMWGN